MVPPKNMNIDCTTKCLKWRGWPVASYPTTARSCTLPSMHVHAGKIYGILTWNLVDTVLIVPVKSMPRLRLRTSNLIVRQVPAAKQHGRCSFPGALPSHSSIRGGSPLRGVNEDAGRLPARRSVEMLLVVHIIHRRDEIARRRERPARCHAFPGNLFVDDGRESIHYMHEWPTWLGERTPCERRQSTRPSLALRRTCSCRPAAKPSAAARQSMAPNPTPMCAPFAWAIR